MKREARVYFKDQLAGYLVEDRDKEAYIFSYDRKYLQDKGKQIALIFHVLLALIVLVPFLYF